MGKTKRAFGPRFTRTQRADAVELLERGDVTAGQLAEDLGISVRTLHRCKKELEESEAVTPLTKDEREELKRLRKEVKRQQDSIEIKKRREPYLTPSEYETKEAA